MLRSDYPGQVCAIARSFEVVGERWSLLIVHEECGGAVDDRGICESCGKVLHARDTRAVPGPGLAASAGDAETVPAR